GEPADRLLHFLLRVSRRSGNSWLVDRVLREHDAGSGLRDSAIRSRPERLLRRHRWSRTGAESRGLLLRTVWSLVGAAGAELHDLAVPCFQAGVPVIGVRGYLR